MWHTETKSKGCSSVSASSLNAGAVALMCEGSFLDALSLLHGALHCIKLSSLAQPAAWPLPRARRSDQRRTVRTIGLTVEIPEGSDSVDSALRMYKRAFLTTSTSDDDGPLSDLRAACTLEAVLQYNAGLCCHVLAFTLRDGLGACLLAARNAYCDALRLLDPELASSSDGRLLHLALCNNVGHICVNLCEFQEAELLLLMLRQFLVRFQELEGGHGPVDDSLFEFYYNVIAVRGTHHCAPAA